MDSNHLRNQPVRPHGRSPPTARRRLHAGASVVHEARVAGALTLGDRPALNGRLDAGGPRKEERRTNHVELPLHDVGAAADKVEGMLLPDLRAPNGAEPPDEGVLGITWEGDARELAEHDLGVLAQTTGGLDAEGGVDVGQTLA